jgi:hypothetical protein
MFLTPTNWQSGMANLLEISNGGRQDQILEMNGAYVLETPEPGTLLIGLLLAPAVYLRRRLSAKAG